MIHMTRRGVVIPGSDDDFEAAERVFAARHCLTLEGFVDSDLLAVVRRALAVAPFHDRSHDGIGTELCLSEGPLSAALEFLWNSPVLSAAVDRITGCGPIGCFEGRVYRMLPARGHYDSWHSDVGEDRRVAMSVNLSADRYQGGVTEFRHPNEEKPFHRVANTGFGDAIIFRIDRSLRHQVTEVTGRFAKTAYAGWFRTSPDYPTLFQNRHGLSIGRSRAEL
jgi:2OG-Fe(II) oxygenase superfamily